jgi:hypothetical protein
MNGGISNIACDHGKSNSFAYSALTLISRQLPANRTLNIRNKPRAGKYTSRFFSRSRRNDVLQTRCSARLTRIIGNPTASDCSRSDQIRACLPQPDEPA